MAPVITEIGVKMKNSFTSYVLLVLCVDAAVAQFVGGPSQPELITNKWLSLLQAARGLKYSNLEFLSVLETTQTFPADLGRSRLSPQQQGHILSDIQQHQHRFSLHQNILSNPQFPRQQALVLPNNGLVNQQTQHHQPSFNLHQHGNRHLQNPQHLVNQQPQIAPSVDPPFALDQSQQHQGQFDPEKQKQRLKELQEKQAIIEKHNQFVEKQYEKALKKAQTDHVDFVEQQKDQKKKLYTRLYKPPGSPVLRYSLNNPRYIYPEETNLFKTAVKKYYEEHPTTTTTTTTTTTPAPSTTKKSKVQLEDDEDEEFALQTSPQSLYNQIKIVTSGSQEKDKVAASSERSGKQIPFLPTALPAPRVIQSLDDLSQLQSQYKNHEIGKDDLLAQLRLAIGENPEDELGKNITSREISLANGQKVQIIRTSDPELIKGATPLQGGEDSLPQFVFTTTTTTRPPKEYIEELTKGVLPPGANFELLRHGENGGLEKVKGFPSSLPDQKKVTFVLLEEQSDGSYKVQGVKGNPGDKEKSEADLDSILKRIKEGEIKLPPPSPRTPIAPAPTVSAKPSTQAIKTTRYAAPTPTTPPVSTTKRQYTIEPTPSVTVLPNSFATSDRVTKTFKLSTNLGISSPSTYSTYSTTPRPTSNTFSVNLNETPSTKATPRVLYTGGSNDLIRQASTASSLSRNSIYSTNFGISSTFKPNPTVPSLPQSYATTAQNITTVAAIPIFQSSTSNAPNVQNINLQELPDVLKQNGMFAMAKFLRQSGLDTILNETGPYTVFAPTDKAFRTLLVQLGGPEKAEDKFKENPRLLSGLLLHHVIPGAFALSSLQDEMTGVSLAGTQLRVNQYKMHDLEWNDVKITTINGAKVLEEKKDIEIPQGTAHAIDRVMFPLPVGDIVQTLQSDRERRFTNFLRALFTSGLAESLQGTKTFTLFAPTDKAFLVLSVEDITKTVTDRALARELIMRHLIPGTLYTTGMRYYQIRDSLEADRQITLSKSSGKVKVNNAQIVTQNIPATNGVIHAVDVLL